MLIALNRTVRRQRRRLVMLAAMLGLVGAVVVAHSAMNHAHMGDLDDAVVTCLAVAETAFIAVGAALAVGAWMLRTPRPFAQLPEPQLRFVPAPASTAARAGPPLLQVFRL